MGIQAGQTIGRYQVMQQLGEGGMATVYKAYDPRLERSVAVKVIRGDQIKDPQFLKRFEREARALAQLSHPHIVKVLDYGDHEGAPYLVMEFIPAGTLKGRFQGALPPAQAARLLAPVARALAYAHQRQVVHRDVKPANILLGEDDHPMLSDFGIAKLLGSDEGADLTGTGVGIGTPEYMAPEQGMGKKVDGRADLYSLGLVFYELVTGQKPFQADTPLAVLLKQIHDPLPLPRSLNPALPEGVERVLLKALAKDPKDRYQDMGEFAAVLERIAAAGLEAFAEETSVLPAMPPVRNRRRKLVWAMVAALLLLIGLFCFLPWLLYQLNICLPEGPWPAFPWCGKALPPDYNRLVCPPPGPWPLPPWCAP